MTNPSTKTALILGATGRFGRHMAQALHNDGWNIVCQSRSTDNLRELPGTPLTAKLGEAELQKAANQCQLIVHSINPPYPMWHTELPKITQEVTKLAEFSGATVLIPGNVYNFGAEMPSILTENTPQEANSGKGKLRIEMEDTFFEASERRVQTIILRIGDFLENRATGNWFDTHMTGKLAKGKLTYPGRTDIPHAWGYLPDVARAAVELANIREDLPAYSDIPFPGTTLSGEEMRKHVENTLQYPVRFSKFPWPVLRLLGQFSPLMREVVEMRYLWDTPHQLNGTKFNALLPDFEFTPTEVIFADLLQTHKKATG